MVRRRRGRPRFDPARGLKGIALLLAIAVAGIAALNAVTLLDRVRRSVEAPVAIVAREPYSRVGNRGAVTLGGWDLSYTFVVDRLAYDGRARRPWTDVDARAPKICHAPNDPADHWLVAGTYRCGDPFAAGD